jgi:membrane dipeptidase
MNFAMTHPLVFDGHNDVLLRIHESGDERGFLAGCAEGHLDLPRMKAGGFGGGMFAVYIPSGGLDKLDDLMNGASYDVPLPPPIGQAEALPSAFSMVDSLFRVERAAAGALRVCRTAAEIRNCFASGTIAAVLHFEGAEAIGADLSALETFYAAGLRSIGPVWSRPTVFGHGVPFRFPSTGDTGAGLTDAGKALVRACDDLGIAMDLSHLNEKGFWDVAKISRKPLIATHSNAHALCAHSRNLTDDQLRAIRATGGLAGLNFATCFLRADGVQNADTPLETMLRHLDHMTGILGEDHVGLGSDFDGAMIPQAIGDAAGLPKLIDAMAEHQYGEALLRKVCHENWINALERVWGG